MEVTVSWSVVALLLLLVSSLIYRRIIRNHGYFKGKPIPSLDASPLFGSTGSVLMKKTNFYDFIGTAYNRFSSAKLFGMFDALQPIYVLRDVELIKRIAVKDFDYFVDRRNFFEGDDAENPSTLLGKTVLHLKGQKWRDMRATLSPAFTGSKMKQMFELIEQYSQRMLEIVTLESRNVGYADYEMKDFYSRIASDIIATCAFGLEVESLKNKTNNFFTSGKKMFNFTRPKTLLKVFGFMVYPKMMTRMGIDLFDRDETLYFSNIIMEAVRTREAQGIVRPDMIHILMQARKGTLKYQAEPKDAAGFATVQESEVGTKAESKTINDSQLIAQCMVFFLAGFETISSQLTFLSYDLMMNPDIQQKLFEEIQSINDQLEGAPLTYDTLQKLKYMDMVISESLRMWSVTHVDRLCLQDYQLDDGAGLQLTIEKGSVVWIPVAAIHKNPTYYPNPDKFDPERFSETNRTNINLAAYLPFGVGPRNCIGSRFALMEIKAIMYTLLLNFKIERNDQSQIPVKLGKGFVGLATEKGMHLRLRLRQN